MKRLLSLLLVASASTVFAQDRADLERTQVIGNRELPKVLYIVPWKKPVHLSMGGRPVASVLDEALAPVDREVLRRHISYDQQLRTAATAPTATATSAPEKTQ